MASSCAGVGNRSPCRAWRRPRIAPAAASEICWPITWETRALHNSDGQLSKKASGSSSGCASTIAAIRGSAARNTALPSVHRSALDWAPLRTANPIWGMALDLRHGVRHGPEEQAEQRAVGVPWLGDPLQRSRPGRAVEAVRHLDVAIGRQIWVVRERWPPAVVLAHDVIDDRPPHGVGAS